MWKIADDQTTALLQPTRRRLFALLQELGRPASTAELAAGLRLHPNGVRTHLAQMAEAGLVVRRRVALPRGRPRDAWTIAPDAWGRGEDVVAYQTVAAWLARSIPATPSRLGEVRATGREIGRELAAGRDRAAGAGALLGLLGGLGFAPEVDRAREGGLSCRLRTCPYRDSVRANQPVVCTLHRGITEGALDVLAPGARLERFVAGDPDLAGCEVEVALPEAAGAG